ncbi:MAG: tryptophan-rich sensory protein [Candidatus Kaiserbacteria bacterium]|nr:tryptophan-rich sensory protein [Candidatus Kaiserbacteria bacterium]
MKNAYSWYQTLIKPSWAPPAYLFGPVWTFLYAVIGFSFGYVFLKTVQGDITFIVALPFILNLFFNFSFTYFQFKLKNNILAAIDILLVFGTLLWAMGAVFSYFPLVTYANIPYLLWVSFATVLQLTVAYLNR